MSKVCQRPPSRRPGAFPGLFFGAALLLAAAGPSAAQDPPAASVWMRLDPLPAEMPLTTRESFEGVPPRFVLMTDGSVFVGGRRELLRGRLDNREMQAMAGFLDAVRKSFGKAGPPPALTFGEGPATFRFSVLLGSPLQTLVMGPLPEEGAPTSAPLPDLIRTLAGFRHSSLRLFDPPQYAMMVREKTLAGGCRSAQGLPPISPSLSTEVVVSERVTRGFPTGAEMAQVCEGGKRFTVVFRPLIPGER